MSSHKVDEVDHYLADVAQRILVPVLLEFVKVDSLALVDGSCTIIRIGENAVVKLVRQTSAGVELIVSLLFVRMVLDDGDVALCEANTFEDELINWRVAEVQLEGALTRMLEMTRSDCEITAPELEALYEAYPWEGCAPVDDSIMVWERMEEIKRQLEILQSFQRFFQRPNEDER